MKEEPKYYNGYSPPINPEVTKGFMQELAQDPNAPEAVRLFARNMLIIMDKDKNGKPTTR